MPSTIRYEDDVIAWAAEQASLLREGRFDQLDREHVAEEIEDVGKSEQRELGAVDIHRSRSDCGPSPRWLRCGSSK